MFLKIVNDRVDITAEEYFIPTHPFPMTKNQSQPDSSANSGLEQSLVVVLVYPEPSLLGTLSQTPLFTRLLALNFNFLLKVQ
jgi:hypothetical protein